SDFFQTGHNFSTNLGISTRTENTTAYFSYTFTDAEGVVPLNAMQSHNLNVRMSTKLLDRLTLDTKINYIRRDIDNITPTGDTYSNPVRSIYKMPANIATKDAQEYEFTDPEGVNTHHFWVPGLNAPSNPYWAINNLTNEQLEERVIGLISLKYDITDNLSFLARSAIDRSNSHRSDRFATDTYIIADLGFYQTRDNRGFEWNSDVLLNYNKDLTSDFSLDVSAGANVRRNQSGFIQGNPNGRNSPLNVPNLFSYGNTANIQVSEGFSEREIQSVYGFATLGWKNAIYMDITGRNDWSSTLSAENRSFFYPSVGLTVVASDLMSSTPSWLSLLKFRGSYAEVGNDTDPYSLVRQASVTGGGRGGFLALATTIPLANLLPETTKSIEVGADIRLFNNRLGLDLTYYKSNTTDQLFPVSVPIASGASNVFTNGADVQNTGFEAVITGGILRSSNFNWDVTINFAKNDSEVLEIAEGFDQLIFSGGFLREFRVEAGQPWGNLYSRGFARDDQGRVIVESNGLPRITPGIDALTANFNPDFLAGVRNSFSYKNLNFSFLVDIRQGGSVVSFSNAIMWADGATQATVPGRDGGLIFGENVFEGETAVLEDGTPNNLTTNSEKLWTLLGGRNSPVGEAFVLDASNVRLREAVLGYSLPNSVLANTPFTNAKISFIGRNLFFFSNKAGNVDPEIFQNTGRAAEGTENFGPPTTREYGVNLKFGF
ncbi:MAG: TonB-dependent receptor, partial [Saprospiraceae bacterium]|nr:TonB-dependent receptor [Saprospiraceae bacterium]